MKIVFYQINIITKKHFKTTKEKHFPKRIYLKHLFLYIEKQNSYYSFFISYWLT